MRNDLLNREEALKLVGAEKLALVDAEAADFSPNSLPDADNEIEFLASINWEDNEGYEVVLRAHYYQDADRVNDEELQLDDLDWVCAGYSVD